MNIMSTTKFQKQVRFAQTLVRIEDWYRQAITMRELAKLDDLQLKDIGVARMDIPVAANDAVKTMKNGKQSHA